MFLSHSRKAMKKFRSVFINKRQRIPKGKSKTDIPEKLVAQSTQDEEKQKHNIICVEHHYAQTNTNNVNKT